MQYLPTYPLQEPITGVPTSLQVWSSANALHFQMNMMISDVLHKITGPIWCSFYFIYKASNYSSAKVFLCNVYIYIHLLYIIYSHKNIKFTIFIVVNYIQHFNVCVFDVNHSGVINHCLKEYTFYLLFYYDVLLLS